MSPCAAAVRLPEPDPVRVLIVDDSAVVRGFMSQWLQSEPGMVVAGTATNGRDALQRLDEVRPDLVLLDLDMPVMDGFATLPALLARKPGLSVVVVSTLTRRNAEVSLACLARGAADYLTKPEAQRAFVGPTAFRQELVGKIRGLSGRHVSGSAQEVRALPTKLSRAEKSPPVRPRIVAIGASTGGPQAVAAVLGGVGEVSRAIPIMVVQHMPEIFTTVFAEQLKGQTGLAVAEARDGEPVRAGQVYLAPGGVHMRIETGESGPAIRLDRGAPVNHCRPAVDVLFADMARHFGPAALGIVLTGMGVDGTEGARALEAAGGSVIAQDERTSLVWGMPGSVAKAGLARQVIPLDAIPAAIRKAAGFAC